MFFKIRQTAKNKKRLIEYAVLSVLILIIVGTVCQSFIYALICKTRVFEDFEASIDYRIMLANIKIHSVQEISRTEDTVTYSYTSGSSGVIFRRDGDTYYALTAAHVVTGENTDYAVRTYLQPSYEKYSETAAGYVSYSSYYEALLPAKVEYIGEMYDLAVISFQCSDELTALEVSRTPPQYGDRLAAIGGHYSEEIFSVSYGTVITREPVEFGDEQGKDQYRVIRHSAYEKPGDSGSALLNINMEIAGINLGGGTDIFGNFRYGIAMSSDKVLQFLSEAGI